MGVRFKKRFLFVQASASRPLAVPAGRMLFARQIASLGDPQVSLKYFSEEKQEGVVKCLPASLEKLKNAFSKSVVFEGLNVAFKVRKTSASFALRKYGAASKETIK